MNGKQNLIREEWAHFFSMDNRTSSMEEKVLSGNPSNITNLQSF
jgi:hypothetical protein